jgi:pimeloyl-ACP methyl ester carboxylesterase
MAQHIPQNHFIVFEGAGHVPSVTRPGEVAQEIERFLKA